MWTGTFFTDTRLGFDWWRKRVTNMNLHGISGKKWIGKHITVRLVLRILFLDDSKEKQKRHFIKVFIIQTFHQLAVTKGIS